MSVEAAHPPLIAQGRNPLRLLQTFRKLPFSFKLGSTIVAVVALLGILAPLLTPYDPVVGNFREALQPPSLAHPFGTDNFGRDILARVLYGARIDLEIGFITTYVPLLIGVALGAIAGYVGGWLDNLLMRIVDLLIAFPFLVLIIVILAILGPGIQNMYIAVFSVGWTMYARLTRAEMLVIREQEYILAARALGYGRRRIIFRHALPNLIGSSLVFSMSDFVLNILLASSLSFFGMGVQPPAPEWGAIIAEGRDWLLQAWWISTLPGIALIVTGLGLSLIGDGLARMLGQRQPAL
jgi:peptide/nickel transport system permease protein